MRRGVSYPRSGGSTRGRRARPPPRARGGGTTAAKTAPAEEGRGGGGVARRAIFWRGNRGPAARGLAPAIGATNWFDTHPLPLCTRAHAARLREIFPGLP